MLDIYPYTVNVRKACELVPAALKKKVTPVPQTKQISKVFSYSFFTHASYIFCEINAN